MIVGSTISKEGTILQKLPVSTKVAIGLAPSGQKNFPERLDHFILLKKGTEKGAWVIDQEKMEHYAPKCKHETSESCEHCCREIKILLLDDDAENVFPHQLAWWSRTGMKCWGDGQTAMRRPDDVSPAKAWTPCRNAGCPDFERGDCSASGDLRFCLADYPILGSICRIHTSSLRSCENIYSGLTLVQTFTGGRLAGVTVPLCVSMEKTNYLDKGQRRATVVPILSIKTGVNELVADIKNTMALWDSARSAFKGRHLLIEDDEVERAAEIPPEFPRKDVPQLPATTEQPTADKPAEEKPPAEPPKPEAPKAEPPKTLTTAIAGEASSNQPDPPKVKLEGFVAEIKKKKTRIKTDDQGNTIKPAEEYWEIGLRNPKAPTDPLTVLLTKDKAISDTAESARKREQEVQAVCEVREEKQVRALKAVEISFFNRNAQEPDTGASENDWALE